jgi:metal-sulfur cluster biosynthetic enzyme
MRFPWRKSAASSAADAAAAETVVEPAVVTHAPAVGAGAAGADPAAELSETVVLNALGEVIDPEIGLDIVTLGLVYDVVVDDGVVWITYTLTTPGCPLEQHITNAIVRCVEQLQDVRMVHPVLVWQPGWHPGLIRETT